MPRITEAAAKARREQILKAAYRCIARSGFGGTTMREVAREAGLSLGGVYGHFTSKDELVKALAAAGRAGTGALLDGARDQRGKGATPAELLEVLLGQLGSKRCLDAVRLDLRLWAESLHHPELRRLAIRAFEAARAPFAEAVSRGQKRKEIPRDLPPELAASVLVAVFLGVAVQKAVDPDTDVEGCSRAVARMLGRS